MKKENFTLYSAYDNLPLAGVVFEPSETPKGIVQLVHGMAEHKERYEEFMTFLCDNGYIAVCHDHRGHGGSMLKEEDKGWFGDYDGVAVVDDTVQVTDYIKERYPGLPVILFGHSMGSLVVRCYAQEHDDKITKLVVCGSPSANPLAGVAVGLEKCIRLFRGARHRSKLLAYLATGSGDARFKGEGKGAWLSRNRANVEKYASDPYSGFRFTCNGYENLFKLLKRTYAKKSYRVKTPQLPILFVAGGDDPVIVNAKKWQGSLAFLRSMGYENVTGKLYDGMRHEILNEIDREEVYADLLEFFEA